MNNNYLTHILWTFLLQHFSIIKFSKFFCTSVIVVSWLLSYSFWSICSQKAFARKIKLYLRKESQFSGCNRNFKSWPNFLTQNEIEDISWGFLSEVLVASLPLFMGCVLSYSNEDESCEFWFLPNFHSAHPIYSLFVSILHLNRGRAPPMEVRSRQGRVKWCQ